MTGMVALLHPFFVSVIEISHNAKDANVEISVRIFTEDLEKTLGKYTAAKVDLLNPTDKALLDKQVSNYISQKLRLKINGQPVTMQYLGHEQQKESTWIYLEVPRVPLMNVLSVDCTLLYDYEKAQSNIFHIRSKGADKSFKLDYPSRNTNFSF